MEGTRALRVMGDSDPRRPLVNTGWKGALAYLVFLGSLYDGRNLVQRIRDSIKEARANKPEFR